MKIVLQMTGSKRLEKSDLEKICTDKTYVVKVFADLVYRRDDLYLLEVERHDERVFCVRDLLAVLTRLVSPGSGRKIRFQVAEFELDIHEMEA